MHHIERSRLLRALVGLAVPAASGLQSFHAATEIRKLPQNVRECPAGQPTFGRLRSTLLIPGEVPAAGGLEQALIPQHCESALNRRGGDLEAVGQLAYGSKPLTGLDTTAADLLPEGVGGLLEGLSGVVFSDRHSFERTGQHVLARLSSLHLAQPFVLVHAGT